MNIPAPLLDRMEVIRLSGYTEDEKLNIAKRHLLPKQIERNALKKGELTVDDSAIIGIIRYYTREAGVRSLEREISKLCRKAVKQLLLDKSLKHIEINGENLHDYLGVQRFDYGRADSENRVGQVDRSGVDGSGRRSADHRNRLRAGQRQADLHRLAGRR
ncbi:DNA-binding ATP-dependent protease La [Klebsiella pneumoniae]|uniref:DNA-binding ATP-dependent protease La n=1 Tax=Klebsiella pneumoniae TaxID=573 RepID=A0A2X3E1H8_KLEPN|nr:DNA-binding ATP-dependent protease La [Klebsiella pneumoniae]